MVVVVAGTVIRFDETKGYGFASPDGGGEDVFIHVNDFGFDKSLLAQGSRIEFITEEGDRGPKASRIRLADGSRAYTPQVTRVPPASPVDDDTCDVLPAAAFIGEVTEALLDSSPQLSGEQIVAIRRRILALAQSHGWIE